MFALYWYTLFFPDAGLLRRINKMLGQYCFWKAVFALCRLALALSVKTSWLSPCLFPVLFVIVPAALFLPLSRYAAPQENRLFSRSGAQHRGAMLLTTGIKFYRFLLTMALRTAARETA
jgi:hypothetical protein